MNIPFVQAACYTRGRVRKVQGIIIHRMAGSYNGSMSWFRNPASQASAHYLISKAGNVTQMVHDEDTAWHAGHVSASGLPSWLLPNPNWSTIGIEHEDGGAPDVNFWTPQEVAASAAVIDMICKKFGIPKDRSHILGHNQTDPARRAHDPGSFTPWDKLLNATYPVDNRYGGHFNAVVEATMKANLWLIGKIHRKPTQREVNALVYGHWGYPEVYQGTVGDQWLYKVKGK